MSLVQSKDREIDEGPLGGAVLADVSLCPPFIRVRLRGYHQVLSFAPIHGGMVTADEVLWLGLKDVDLRPPVSPQDFYASQLDAKGFSKDAVGMMTSADITKFCVKSLSFGKEAVTAVATVGLGNRRRIGDPPGPQGVIRKSYGTINVLLVSKHALSQEAMLEGMSLMAEARTLAMVESGLTSPMSGEVATGTGTDCLTLASPLNEGPGLKYAGKHTAVGHLIGEAVYQAVREGVGEWKRQWVPTRSC